MKKALISPNEPVGLGCRVVQVCDAEFDVAAPLFWADCPDDLDITAVCYDTDLLDFRALPEQPPAPVKVPQVVKMRQARLALLQSGYLATVDALIAGMAGIEGDAARIDWEFAETVERSCPLVAAMASALSLTEKQLDDLFTLAGGL